MSRTEPDMLRIEICDDEREAVEAHAEQVCRIMRQMRMKADIQKCYTGNELLLEIEENGKFHIIPLDIEMEYMNGIESNLILCECKNCERKVRRQELIVLR